MMTAFQTALRLVYPPRCLLCETRVESDFGLCGTCWRETPFITGLVCDLCGVPLPGEGSDEGELCDDCLRIARPWQKGRAALLYRDNARKLVLALKHGDRHDIVKPAALWLAHMAEPLWDESTLMVPIPLHWTRMLRRRFNQSALLAQAVAQHAHCAYCPDLLNRPKRTQSLDGLGFESRFKAVDGAIDVNPAQAHHAKDRRILLVDDVMTSGATFSAATQACQQAGAKEVCVLALARVAKDP